MKHSRLHRLHEDLFALFSASVLIGFGLFVFKEQGFVSGGTAGLALVISHVLPLSFGTIFFVINLPFYLLAWKELGVRFTVNTFICVFAVSAVTDLIHSFVPALTMQPVFAAVLGGLLIGVGMLLLLRHQGSLGGVTILGVYLQNRYGLRLGWFQMGVDMCILCTSFFIVSPWVLLLSVMGTALINFVLGINHRPGRYLPEGA